MINQVQLKVLQTMAKLKSADPDTSIPITLPGMTAERVSDVLGQLLQLGAIRHFYDFGDGEVSVIPDDITPLGRRLLEQQA